ncbi:MAG: DNA polymerase III subunit beta [Thermodesulfobacteriota bacterium]|nr:DNA polymerase III subunit beta [Thermodesulfobacteriota bacterium]
MEFIIKREDLLKSLLISQGVIEKRSVMPILENILIDVTSGRMEFIATDLEIGIHGSCEVDVIEEGKTLLLVKKVLNITRELSEKDIRLKEIVNPHGGREIEIFCGRAEFNINTSEYIDFPNLPLYENVDLFGVDSEKLRDMIAKTIYAASVDERRYNLNGVFFEKEEKKIRMVATNGHRLSLIERESDEVEGLHLEKGVTFPRKGLNELKRILEEYRNEKKVYIGFKGNNGVFRIDRLTMIMRLIEGDFPDYRTLIPKENEKKFFVNRRELLGLLKRVSSVCSDRLRPLKFNLTQGKMSLCASIQNEGEAYDEIDLDYEGDDLTIGFNTDYFIEALNNLESEEVRIELKDNVKPAVIRMNNRDNYVCIIMPMRI